MRQGTGLPRARPWPVIVPDVVNANALVRDRRYACSLGAGHNQHRQTCATISSMQRRPRSRRSRTHPSPSRSTPPTSTLPRTTPACRGAPKSGCSAPTIPTATGSPPSTRDHGRRHGRLLPGRDSPGFAAGVRQAGLRRWATHRRRRRWMRTTCGSTNRTRQLLRGRRGRRSRHGGRRPALCPKAGCATPTTLAAGLHHPGTIAIDATRVYWADQGTVANLYRDGDVGSCPKSGCTGAPVVHASGQSLPTSVAVDDACVYWASDSIHVGSPPPPRAARPDPSRPPPSARTRNEFDSAQTIRGASRGRRGAPWGGSQGRTSSHAAPGELTERDTVRLRPGEAGLLNSRGGEEPPPVSWNVPAR